MTYKVIVTREGDSWLADVPDVPGAHTFARSLEGLDRSVREVIILMDDLADDADIEVVYDYQVDDQAVVEAAVVGKERARIALDEAVLKASTARMIRALTDHGYSVRDSAHLLGITPGRVSQLSNADTVLTDAGRNVKRNMAAVDSAAVRKAVRDVERATRTLNRDVAKARRRKTTR